jgi:prophage regulatory protein
VGRLSVSGHFSTPLSGSSEKLRLICRGLIDPEPFSVQQKEKPVGPQPTNPNSRLGIRTGPEADANRPLRFLRFPAVRACTGLSRTTIWRLERQGGFPRHRRISRNAVAWAEHEVSDWIRSKLGANSQSLS